MLTPNQVLEQYRKSNEDPNYTLPINYICRLYSAKCEDQSTTEVGSLKSSFIDHCMSKCKDGKLILSQLGLGPMCTQVIKQIVGKFNNVHYLVDCITSV